MRKYFTAGVIAILVLAVLASVAAVSQAWGVAIILTQGTILFAVLTILLSARYVVRLLRTQERKSRRTTQELMKLFEDSAQRDQEILQQLRQSQKTIQTTVIESTSALTTVMESTSAIQDSTSELKTQGQQDVEEILTLLGKTSRDNRRHVTSTVRDSTRQVESLLQIFARFKDLKLALPSTGGFAIDSQALAHLLSLVEERRPKKILELGSGTSTVWLGYLCQEFGGTLVTVDHLEQYLELTRTAVNRHELQPQVESRLAPLEEVTHGDDTYNWYAPSQLNDLADIDLVLIDGPPAATGPQARYPALPQIIDFLAPHATVILDDAHRQEEADIIDAWLTEFPDFKQIEVGTSRLAVIERKP